MGCSSSRVALQVIGSSTYATDGDIRDKMSKQTICEHSGAFFSQERNLKRPRRADVLVDDPNTEVPEVVEGCIETVLPPGAIPTSPVNGGNQYVVPSMQAPPDDFKDVLGDQTADPTQISLEPIQASFGDMPVIFREYVSRVPDAVSQTLNCTWEHLAAHALLEGPPLQWFWLTHSESDRKICSARSAVGLLVFRPSRFACRTRHCCICHFSMAGSSWEKTMPLAISTVRRKMLEMLPVDGIRVALWYAVQDGNLKLDPGMEAMFEQSGFRWFQLVNSKDTSRRLVMASWRRADDPPTPEEVLDMRISSCIFMPCIREIGNGGDGDGAERKHAEANQAPCNNLVMAECLRRHALLQRDDLCKVVVSGKSDAPCEAGQCLVGELYRKLQRRGTLRMVRTSAVACLEDGAAFVDQCFEGLGGSSALPSTVLSHLPARKEPNLAEATPFESCAVKKGEVLCGSLTVNLNWAARSKDTVDQRWVRAPIRATSASASAHPEAGRPEVVYLGTEDDDIFVSVSCLSENVSPPSTDDLPGYCRKLLRDYPPAEVGETQCWKEVHFPPVRLKTHAGNPVPRICAGAEVFGQPLEVLNMRLAVRPDPPGALRPRGIPVPTKENVRDDAGVIVIDRSFVFCVWQVKLEDLQVPLFSVVVRREDFELDKSEMF